MVKRIISLIIVFVMLFSLCPLNSFADDYVSVPRSKWEQILVSLVRGTSQAPFLPISVICQVAGSRTTATVCAHSPDGVHHCDSLYGADISGGDGTMYARCTCKYCGERFKVYADDLRDAYAAQTDALATQAGTTNFSGDGYPLIFFDGFYVADLTSDAAGSVLSSLGFCQPYFTVNRDKSKIWVVSNSVSIPSAGTYEFYSNITRSNLRVYSSSSKEYASGIILKYADVGSPISAFLGTDTDYYNGGLGYSDNTGILSKTVSISQSAFDSYYNNPAYEVRASIRLVADSTYETYARLRNFCLRNVSFNPAGVTVFDVTDNSIRAGAYVTDGGYYVDGNMVNVENLQIVNEDNHTVYNPVLDQTYYMDTYNYDYSTMTYDFTYSQNGIVYSGSVHYGDNYVTIINDNHTENIYYVTQEPEGYCEHEYQEDETVPATCTRNGMKVYTCSKCGDSYTEVIPALGHDWHLTEQVPDVLDENNNVVTEGYDLYTCSVCGDTYKDYNGTGPPGAGAGTGGNIGTLLVGLGKSLGDLFGGVIKWILDLGAKAIDGLSVITDFFTGLTTDLAGIGGGFKDFLVGGWAVLPPDIILCFKVMLFFGLMGLFVTKVLL